jgi:AraC-like DNA-binding protein
MAPERIRGSGSARSWFILAGRSAAPLPLRVTEIGASWWPDGEHCARACSPIMAVELVLRGTIRLEQDGATSEVGAGEAFVLRRGARHRYGAVAGAVRKVYLGLAGPLAEEVVGRLPSRVVWRDAPQALALYQRLRRLVMRPRGDWHAQASALGYQLLVELLLSCPSAAGGTQLHPAVTRVLPLLEGRAGRALSTADLAQRAGVSAAHLNRLFRAGLQTTPQRYGLLHALRQAQALLLGSDRPCNAIARELGFTPLYFSAAFRRVIGLSPSAFRARHR